MLARLCHERLGYAFIQKCGSVHDAVFYDCLYRIGTIYGFIR